jgi:hypothetical protein
MYAQSQDDGACLRMQNQSSAITVAGCKRRQTKHYPQIAQMTQIKTQ